MKGTDSSQRSVARPPTGNTFDKYGSRSLLVRWMMHGFTEAVFSLLDAVQPRGLLDVGCGEGFMCEAFLARYPKLMIHGLDLEDAKLRSHWETIRSERLSFTTGIAEDLPFADNSFDTITALEVLEHVRDPIAALGEMARVAQSSLVLSVPREPLWRCLNMLRGAYLKSLGNTPGHLNHWSRSGFVDLVGQFGRVVEVRSPLPWTVVRVELG